MPLEAGDFIPDLNANNPLGSDAKSEGDDHLRLVKRCTQGSFPAFVGTQATPKSVSLTEDQINDTCRQSEAATVSGAWTITAPWSTTAAYTFDSGATVDQYIFRGGAAPIVVERIGSDTNNSVHYKTDNFDRYLGITDGRLKLGDNANLSAGTGEFVATLNDADRKTGFRNPPFNQQNVSYTVLQSDEGAVVRKSSGGNESYTIPILEALTTMTVINDDTNSTITLVEGSGVTMVAHVGGSRINAPLTLAQDSVVQLYWVTTTLVSVWGNGIS